MKLRSVVFSILFIGLLYAFTPRKLAVKKEDDSLRIVHQSSFKKGEFLQYDVSYGFFDAAKATLEVAPSSKKINGRNTMHIVGKGKSTGALRWFFKIDDHYETYIDEEAVLPWKFIRHVREGSYKLDRNIDFDQYCNQATVFQKDTKNYTINPNTQDLLSAFYYARTLDLQNAEINQEFVINTFFDREMYPLKIKFIGKEKVKTKLGDFNCLKFRPMVEKGRVFKEEEDLTLWISDDNNKVPVRLKANLLVGSIKMDLVEYKNLSEKLNQVSE
tara:strand:+ start:458 stop:1276 length:819 start_codon:yes stop_codon:yes gene_type:complete